MCGDSYGEQSTYSKDDDNRFLKVSYEEIFI